MKMTWVSWEARQVGQMETSRSNQLGPPLTGAVKLRGSCGSLQAYEVCKLGLGEEHQTLEAVTTNGTRVRAEHSMAGLMLHLIVMKFPQRAVKITLVLAPYTSPQSL